MNILVTGAAGYIGSVLVPKLLVNNLRVKAVDTFYFGEDKLTDHPNLEKIHCDVREFDESLLKGVDAVIDLVAISNDPSGEAFEESTYDINYKSRVNIAKLAKEYGVKRYILPSSCSIYGFQEEDILLTEESPINPLTTYAKANRMAEEGVLSLVEDGFCVTVMRQATVFGPSKRMRYDLAINAMTERIFTENRLSLMRDGQQWRPFVHVEDTTDCMLHLLQYDTAKINGQIFNVGSNNNNYQLMDLAKAVLKGTKSNAEIEWYGDPDNRSYKVDFSKIENFTGWKAKRTVIDGVEDIIRALEKHSLIKDKSTLTLNWYKKLVGEGFKI